MGTTTMGVNGDATRERIKFAASRIIDRATPVG